MPALVAELIRELQLEPHPEGGHFRRVYESAMRLSANGHMRPALTAIRYLLARGQCSRWHRIDADECWHWQQGDSLELRLFDADAGELKTVVLGDAASGLAPMHVVPAGIWQAARPLADYVLVACTVAPGFVWEGFEMLEEASEAMRLLRQMGAAD